MGFWVCVFGFGFFYSNFGLFFHYWVLEFFFLVFGFLGFFSVIDRFEQLKIFENIFVFLFDSKKLKSLGDNELR